jgi:hypothetical protein
MRYSRPRAGKRLVRTGLAAAATTAIVVAAAATPAFAADVDFALDVNTGPVGGGNTVVGTGTGLLTGVTTPGARFIVGASTACPATYGTASTGAINATATKGGDDDTINITVPAVVLAATYRVCVYVGTATGSVTQGKTTSGEAYAADVASVSLAPNASGPATTASPVSIAASTTGGGTWAQGITTIGTIFTTAATCPTTYTATGAVVGTTTKNAASSIATTAVPTTLTAGSTYNVCYYNGTAPASALVAKTQYSVVPAATLTPAVGPSGGTNSVIFAGSSNFLTTGQASPGVIFTRLACPNTYVTGNTDYPTVTTPLKISNSRVAATVPAGVALTGSESSVVYKGCLYNGSTNGASTLAAQGVTYTIGAAVTVTSIAPASGPSQGGQEVTITGANFPTAPDAAVSVSIGGSPLTNVRVSNATTIVGTTSSHAPGAVGVSVTTAAGTKSATGTPYTYTFGITVLPNTAPSGTDITLDIQGAGFSNLTWGSTNIDAGYHVFLVNDRYAAAGTTTWTTAPDSVCTSPIVISDNELICTLQLDSTLDTAGLLVSTPPDDGVYSIEMVSTAVPGATPTVSIVSSGSSFTVAPF